MYNPYRARYRQPKLAKNGQKFEKFPIAQICSMTHAKAISAVGTDIRPIFREIQAPKVDRKWSKKSKNVKLYDAFHTRSDKPGVKGIIEMHRFNICLVIGPVAQPWRRLSRPKSRFRDGRGTARWAAIAIAKVVQQAQCIHDMYQTPA